VDRESNTLEQILSIHIRIITIWCSTASFTQWGILFLYRYYWSICWLGMLENNRY
jgi:hypothetical protein